MPILLALAAAVALSQPTKLVVVDDWIAGCDSGGECQAAQLFGASNDSRSWTGARIEQNGERGAPVMLWLLPGAPVTDGDKVEVLVDRTVIETDDGTTSWAYPLSRKTLRVLARGTMLSIRINGKINTTGSLRGLHSALRTMAAERAAVSARHGLVPDRRQIVPPIGSSAPLAKLLEVSLQRRFGCSVPDPSQFMTLSFQVPLAKGKRLIFLDCGPLGRHFSLILIKQGKRYYSPAFDHPVHRNSHGRPLLAAADWHLNMGDPDEETGVLGTVANYNDRDDCGRSQRFIWDGRRFRLIEQNDMSVCRGATLWLRTWTAKITR